jgi:hypothetical protein
LICTKQVESLIIPIENKICFSWHLSNKLPIFFMCSWIRCDLNFLHICHGASSSGENFEGCSQS